MNTLILNRAYLLALLKRACIGSLFLVSAAASSQTRAPIVIGFDESPKIFGSVWSLRIYTEAFRRMGVPWKPEFVPLARRAALVDEGAIDGDGARVYGYADAHPNLVRVEESVMDLGFALYTNNPKLRLQRIEDLADQSLRSEYRRGINFCETKLKAVVAAERLTDVSAEEQGLKKLAAGRTDVYCDLESVVQKALSTPEFSDAKGIRKVYSLGVLPTYPYLHKKNADLAPRLAATLKQMKAEGLIETYRLDALKELGWAR